jgi:dTDP-4-amino-4,6-dideoxygalactose transaminase
MTVPFNRPCSAGHELEYIAEAISTRKLSGDGPFTDRCQRLIAEAVGGLSALLTHSCTGALEMAAHLAEIEPGDEVIMPSYTFVSTANAVVLRGGVPVFVDVRADTLNLDERLVEAAITNRTKAIVVVHYAGVPAEMDALCEIATRYRLNLIEDAAQAFGSRYKGKPIGSFGAVAAFSFHETKNIISGEGGALVVNNPALIERAEVIREKGTNRRSFAKGEVDKYTWVDIGSSYLPSELVAAFLCAQLECSRTIQADRMKAWKAYDEALRPFQSRGLGTPFIPQHCEHNAHLYFILLPSADAQQEFIGRMRQDGIQTPFHYVPLHSSPAGRRFGKMSGSLGLTEDLSARLVRLPLYPQMGTALATVIARVTRLLEVSL